MATASALIVEPALDDVVIYASALDTLGVHITASNSFLEAKASIDAHPPTILIANIRLGEYNGLHLVLRGRALNSRMAGLVTTRVADDVLRADAEQLGATFVVLPVSQEDFRVAVVRTIIRAQGLAPLEPIRMPFERRRTERRGGVLPRDVAAERRRAERRRDPVDLLKSVLP